MLAASVWWMLVMADCSIAAQDCAAGQMCTGPLSAEGCAERGQCEPLPAPAEMELSLPVAKGERVFCAKGNLRAGRDRHSACSLAERFAFDLASPVFEAPHVVVASADGVAYFWGGCATESLTDVARHGDDACNGGYGNYVRVQHTPDLYTQVLHLSAVLVKWGQPVKRGQPIGIEGNTGSAAPKHIHWSAHRGKAVDGGPSIPMSRIRFQGGTASSSTWKCGDWGRSMVPDPETAYVSDTAPVAPPDPMQFAFTPFSDEVGSAHELFVRSFRDADAALTELRALPDVGVNRYWLGASLHELKKNAEAERVLRTQLKRDLPPGYMPWVHLRLADLAAARGAKGEARALLEKCSSAKSSPEFKERWDAISARASKR